METRGISPAPEAPGEDPRHHVVVIGGGFAGLNAVRSLRGAPCRVTLIDRRNFHLFQPLLYQVATGGLSPAHIASPLRMILRRQQNASVILAEVMDFDVHGRRVILTDGAMRYDTLLVATGMESHYFGNEGWAEFAPGLKTVEDATEIRRRILYAFEAAERSGDPAERRRWLSFAIIGGGPTGVELAGALGEIARNTLRRDFKNIDTEMANITLLEGAERILPTFPEHLSTKAREALDPLCVRVVSGAKVTQISRDEIRVTMADRVETLEARTVVWAAGVTASPLGRKLAERTGAGVDRAGRVLVEPDLTVPGHPEILVLGDLAAYLHQGGKPLPGVAPAAMQQGRYAAKALRLRLAGRRSPAFRYRDKGSLATIGRNAAVAELGRLRFSGRVAWVLWLLVHIVYLIGFENRVLVLIQWAWNYFTWNRNARLITWRVPPGEAPKPTG